MKSPHRIQLPRNSIAELVSPAVIGQVLGRAVQKMERTPLPQPNSSWSGSNLELLHIDDVETLVLKTIAPDSDYFVAATDDTQIREAAIWSSGILADLPELIQHPYLATAIDGTTRALLLQDLTDALFLGRRDASADHHVAILDGLAALHSHFWDSPALANARAGLCPPETHLSIISTGVAERLRAFPGVMPQAVDAGWENAANELPGDLFEACFAITNEPPLLVRHLVDLPQTLVHGDARIANLGTEDGVAVFIDWAIAGVNIPTLDLLWYLSTSSAWVPQDRDWAIAHYRNALTVQLADDVWQRMLDLGSLMTLARMCWFTSTAAARGNETARADLAWWADRARAGLALIG